MKQTFPGFVRVPNYCPLPGICPVCGERATGTFKISAFEGLPLIIGYHLTVPVSYCDPHRKELRRFRFMENIFVVGLITSPFIGIFLLLFAPALFPSLWFCLLAGVCMFFAIRFRLKTRSHQAVRLKTIGGAGAYLLTGLNAYWYQTLRAIVAAYSSNLQSTTGV